MTLLARLETQGQGFKLLLGFAPIVVIGVVDVLTGYELAFSLFYVIPIAFVTWLIGRRAGIMASLASALTWLGADVGAGHLYLHPLIPIWNTLIRLAFFLIIASLLSALKNGLERERALARLDALTGAVNSRFFADVAQMELDRCRRYRHPFTLAYLDLDNFKWVNDQLGHTVGDQVLRAVARCTRMQLRRTDVVARLGGDEFAVLLPETDQEAARVALAKVHGALLAEMRHNIWPITFSIGVLTCGAAPPTADDLIRRADEVMYAVKRDRKNEIRYATYAG